MYSIDYTASAPVFNIQSYCIHDGPGIRSTVFVKGCPLRCLWCANPESNEFYPQLMFYSSKCVGCGRCVPVCPQNGIRIEEKAGKMQALADRQLCTNCGTCTDICPKEAREVAGKQMSVRQAIDKVKQDKLFFVGSGGGMTVSGGEPLSHPVFTANLLAAAHAEGITTAIETSSFASRAAVDQVFPHVDIALLDVKHMDSETHKKLTGVPNEQILENIRYIRNTYAAQISLRVPTIPGYNDSEENIAATARFAVSLGKVERVHLLPYHRLGESKTESLGGEGTLGIQPPSDEHMEHLRKLVERFGVEAVIGG